jgi:hypothetical protein
MISYTQLNPFSSELRTSKGRAYAYESAACDMDTFMSHGVSIGNGMTLLFVTSVGKDLGGAA